MSKGRILVVEDDMDNYELVRFILERAGYDVFLAVNGRDGVDAARFQKPDLILMESRASSAAAGCFLTAGFSTVTFTDTSAALSRPARLTVRRFESFAEADRHDLEYWHAMPASDRLLLVWQLSVELWRWRGEFRDEPGLCRSVAGVRRP